VFVEEFGELFCGGFVVPEVEAAFPQTIAGFCDIGPGRLRFEELGKPWPGLAVAFDGIE